MKINELSMCLKKESRKKAMNELENRKTVLRNKSNS